MSQQRTEHHCHAGMANPTQTLKDEHELILQALEALERKVAAIQVGATPDPAYFEKAVEFLRTFADRCHHGKEEDLLFKRMAERGFPVQGGPIAVMLHEHEMGRAYIRGIAEGAGKIRTDSTAAAQIVENAQGYIMLLRNHISKENTILFPMADQALAPEDQDALRDAFAKFETETMGPGVHEAMHKLLEELKAA